MRSSLLFGSLVTSVLFYFPVGFLVASFLFLFLRSVFLLSDLSSLPPFKFTPLLLYSRVFLIRSWRVPSRVSKAYKLENKGAPPLPKHTHASRLDFSFVSLGYPLRQFWDFRFSPIRHLSARD